MKNINSAIGFPNVNHHTLLINKQYNSHEPRLIFRFFFFYLSFWNVLQKKLIYIFKIKIKLNSLIKLQWLH